MEINGVEYTTEYVEHALRQAAIVAHALRVSMVKLGCTCDPDVVTLGGTVLGMETDPTTLAVSIGYHIHHDDDCRALHKSVSPLN